MPCSGGFNWPQKARYQSGKFQKPCDSPFVAENVLQKRHALKKELLKQTNLVPTRIAILGGSTTAEVKIMLELFLLAQGIQPAFYESGYNRYREDVLFENPDLWNFKPDIVFIHTTWHNVSEFPELLEAEPRLNGASVVKWRGLSLFGKKFTRSLAHSSSRTTLICLALDPSGIWRLPNRSGE